MHNMIQKWIDETTNAATLEVSLYEQAIHAQWRVVHDIQTAAVHSAMFQKGSKILRHFICYMIKNAGPLQGNGQAAVCQMEGGECVGAESMLKIGKGRVGVQGQQQTSGLTTGFEGEVGEGMREEEDLVGLFMHGMGILQ